LSGKTAITLESVSFSDNPRFLFTREPTGAEYIPRLESTEKEVDGRDIIMQFLT
jgi:hypothetical protein